MTGGDHRSGTDRITEAALMEGAENEDIIVNIQGDQPLFEPALIRLMVEPLVEDKSIPMSTLKWRIIAEDDIGNPNHIQVSLKGYWNLAKGLNRCGPLKTGLK